MKAIGVALTLVLVLSACASAPAPSMPANPAPVVAPVPTGRTVRVVRIDPTHFEAATKTDLSAAKTWGADPANAMNVLPAFRHILVKPGAGARRKAEELIARLDRGEDFATLAKSSDDPGSANKGGAYPGRMVKTFVPAMRRAYAELRPGERAKAPVESTFGWHVVAKGPVDDDACVDGHRAWLSRQTAERIGRDLAKRLRHVEGGSVATEIERALGAERRKSDPLPVVVRMQADTCDGFATIARGEGISWRDDALAVAALTNDEREASELESDGCEVPPEARP